MKYTPGPLAGPLSGKIGNTVASKSRTGYYFRLRSSPVNPQSTDQLNKRASLAALAAGWRALTDAQRAAWSAVGQGIERTDSLGNTYNLTGEQAYIANNTNRLLAGVAITATAPALDAPPNPENLAFDDLDAGQVTVSFTPTPLGANTRMKVFGTRSLSPGIAVPGRSAFRLISTTAANPASPLNLATNYIAKFGAPVTGQKVFLRFVPVSVNFWDGVPDQIVGVVA